LAIGLAYPLWHVSVFIESKIKTGLIWFPLALGAVLTILWAGMWGYIFWKELLPPITFTLRITPGLSSNEDFGDGKWDNNWSAVRLEIDNNSDFPVHDLDLTVRVLKESGDVLFGIKQITHVRDVNPKNPELDSDIGIQLIGNDSKAYDIFARDIFAKGFPKGMPFGNYWHVDCAKVLKRDPIILLIASSDKNHNGPTKLRLEGTYEAPSQFGFRVIKFNQDVDVLR
jgi:hypothetical protein